MFCPYVRKKYVRISGIHYKDEIDSDVALEDGSIIYEEFENMKCKKDKCGVWNNGKCGYREDKS